MHLMHISTIDLHIVKGNQAALLRSLVLFCYLLLTPDFENFKINIFLILILFEEFVCGGKPLNINPPKYG